MNHGDRTSATYEPWPRWWRMVLVALCTLILCSCRAGRHASDGIGGGQSSISHQSSFIDHPSSFPPGPPALPRQAFTGAPDGYPCYAVDPTAAAGGAAGGTALSSLPAGPWAPPGMRQPWPQDEYLRDGGDQAPATVVREDWEVRGLNVEDTIAHFDTLDGRRLVQPSNRVHIYSPRFRAVRQVVGHRQYEQRDPWAGVHQPLKLVGHDDVRIATASKQHFQAEAGIGRKRPTIYRSRQNDGAVSNRNKATGYDAASLLAEAPSAIGQVLLEGSEMAWLADGVQAAIAWSSDQPVQVFIDRTKAAAEVSDQKLQTVYTIGTPPGAQPRLRVIKVASTPLANPGETVDFTIRFDNVGGQIIGNVTIIDSLTARLEYVPDSAQCSVAADFLTEPNEGDSLVLRWEITEPLDPGQGGVIRFRCRVR